MYVFNRGKAAECRCFAHISRCIPCRVGIVLIFRVVVADVWVTVEVAIVGAKFRFSARLFTVAADHVAAVVAFEEVLVDAVRTRICFPAHATALGASCCACTPIFAVEVITKVAHAAATATRKGTALLARQVAALANPMAAWCAVANVHVCICGCVTEVKVGGKDKVQGIATGRARPVFWRAAGFGDGAHRIEVLLHNTAAVASFCRKGGDEYCVQLFDPLTDKHFGLDSGDVGRVAAGSGAIRRHFPGVVHSGFGLEPTSVSSGRGLGTVLS